MGIALVLDEVHRSHAAHVVCVAHMLSAWGVQADFAAVASHSAAARLPFSSLIFSFRCPGISRVTVVVDAVVVLTQHRQIRRLRMPAVFVGVDVVDLASIGRYGAVWPWAHEILRHGESAQLVRCEPRFVEIHRACCGVEETDIEFVAKGAGHRSVDEISARHGRAVG